MRRKLFAGTECEMNAGRYTYGRKRDLNGYRYATAPKRYYQVRVWDGQTIAKSYTICARGRKAAKAKATALDGKNVTVTLNFNLQSELF